MSSAWQTHLAALGLCFLGCSAFAEPYVIAGDSGVFCRRDAEGAAGALCDIVQEIQRRLQYTATIDIVPHARLKLLMRQPARNTFFLPAIDGDFETTQLRTVVELHHDEYVIVTSVHGTRAGTVTEARTFDRVGVLRGSAAERELYRMGWTNVEATGSQEACAKKLNYGRLDAWISTWSGARYAASAAGISSNQLKRGERIKDTRLLLVASVDVTAAELRKWRLVFEAMKADGAVGRILNRYDVHPSFERK